MSNRLMVDGLTYTYGTQAAAFYQAIDASGGWPVGYKYIGFCHTDKRECGFTNSSHNDGWWTVIADADDYYLWKLSPEALNRIVDAAQDAFVNVLKYNRVNPKALYIRSSRGYRAELSEATHA